MRSISQYCKKCDKKATNDHLAGRHHVQHCGPNVSGFAFPDRQKLCHEGHVFLSSDGRQTLESPLAPDRPLQVMTVAETEDPPRANIVLYFEIMEVLSSQEVKNTSLGEKLRIRIHWTDGTVDEEIFHVAGCGNTRDAYEAMTSPWILKLEKPITEPRVRNHCEDEWELYMKNDELRKIIPMCYGYAAVRIEGQNIVGLLVERLAFTLDESYRKMRRLEASAERASLMTHMIMRTVEQMTLMAGKGLYHLRDWHVANIAFNNVTHTDCPVDARLIDWSGHSRRPMEPPRDRMAGALVAFTKSLPGPHVWGDEDHSHVSETEQVNMAQWKTYMAQCTDTVVAWWNAFLNFPTKTDLSRLNEQLCDIFEKYPRAAATPEWPQNGPAGTQNELQLWPATPSPSGSLYLQPPVLPRPAIADAVPKAPCTETMPGCPSLVMRALLAAAGTAQQHAESTFRQGNIKRVNTMSLPDRLVASPPNLPHHGHASKTHAYSDEEGHQMGLLFRILLEDFRTSGIIERVQPGYGGRVPAACSDPVKFHKSYAAAFKKSHGSNFQDLSATMQRATLHAFLFLKFSTDPLGKRMVPEDAKRRKTLSWIGFYITDEELPLIVQRVMAVYDVTRASAARSA